MSLGHSVTCVLSCVYTCSVRQGWFGCSLSSALTSSVFVHGPDITETVSLMALGVVRNHVMRTVHGC